MFYLSRAFVELAAPFPLSILLLFCALLLILIRRVRFGAFCLVLALFVQIFFGYGLFVRQRVAALEATYPALTATALREHQEKNLQYVVVLGSGHVSDGRLSVVSQLGGASLYRLIEGIRLLQIYPEARLILSGGAVFDPLANAQLAGEAAESLGISKEKMILETRPRDTLQEAEMLAPILGKGEFILVTSAMHMPRAMRIFKDRGMAPIAAPTDYVIRQGAVKPPGVLLPSTSNLDLSKRLLYEWIAEKWMVIKGVIDRL